MLVVFKTIGLKNHQNTDTKGENMARYFILQILNVVLNLATTALIIYIIVKLVRCKK